jgi:RHS repeat-associated protein
MIYDCPVQHARLRYKFTGKERDSESGLDNFGARYNSANLGRFMSPDPRAISLRRMVDSQQWNMYAYIRNNPMVHVDPDGQELHLVIYNSSSIDKQLITRVAIGIASKYQAAGVKNVSYKIRAGKPGALTQAAAELLPTPHSHLLEIRKDNEGSPSIPNGEGGHNWDFGGHSAVDASVVQGKAPKTDDDLVTGLVNVGTHESGHDVLGHQGGANDVMNPEGEAENSWLFDPNLQFSPAEATALQNKYNNSGEIELTPLPPLPPPLPPCATDKEHPCI